MQTVAATYLEISVYRTFVLGVLTALRVLMRPIWRRNTMLGKTLKLLLVLLLTFQVPRDSARPFRNAEVGDDHQPHHT